MNIDFYSYSGQGGRPVNEDSCITGNGYFVVSDGLGGHDNGEVASGAAVRYISENFTASDLSNERIADLILGADNAVKTSGEGGKATLAAIFTDGEKIRIDNIGDSRVYYFRQGSIFFRTKDHSVCQASVDMGEMTDIDVRKSADRSGLFKVLGDSSPLKLPKPYETIEPINGDAFLICSDGFWEHIYEAEMEADLLKSENARDWTNHMLKRVLLRSENAGDNFTAICGMISSPITFPRTQAAPEPKGFGDYPVTVETEAEPAFPLKGKIFLIGCAIVAAAVIAAALIIVLNKGGKEPPIGDSSVSTLSEPPNISDNSENSQISDNSGESDPENSSNSSENPENFDNSGETDNSDNSENTENPENSENSAPSTDSDNSENTESSENPENSDNSDPENSSNSSENPENSENSDNSDTSSGSGSPPFFERPESSSRSTFPTNPFLPAESPLEA